MNSPKPTYYLLAGDIGGTTTRLALYLAKSKTTLKNEEYFNESYVKTHGGEGAFHVILNEFFATKCSVSDDAVIIACLACAGPIMNNACEFTNAGHVDNKFVIRGDVIEASTKGGDSKIKVCKIINDFVGQGYGCLDIDIETEVVELVPGSRSKISPTGPKICIGAGTGLGECYLTTSSLNPSVGYECFPSEGGHVEFSPRNELETKLLSYLKQKFASKHRVSVERIVSGKGIANVYEFLAKEFPDRVAKDMHEKFLKAGDMQGKIVGENAHPGTLCKEALEIFAAAYGSELGNCCLKWIPTGGVFVTGGIFNKLSEIYPDLILGEESPFMKSFFDKGRVSPILDGVPVFVVKADSMGLRGARVCALKVLENGIDE